MKTSMVIVRDVSKYDKFFIQSTLADAINRQVYIRKTLIGKIKEAHVVNNQVIAEIEIFEKEFETLMGYKVDNIVKELTFTYEIKE